MENLNIVYADPAGNLTAIVRDPVEDTKERKRISQKIMDAGLAEQVGFETTPRMGGDCRLEMMGGEFCGNATRAYGYLCTSERYDGGLYQIHVEISGAPKPVPVKVDLDEGTSYANMPLPTGISLVEVMGRKYPVVHMEGIDHMIVEQPVAPEEREHFVMKALDAMNAQQLDAAGVMFLQGDELVPAVYVRETGSLVWESSCGSGSVASGWYRVFNMPGYDKDSYSITFREPGGELTVEVYLHESQISHCTMGGFISFR